MKKIFSMICGLALLAGGCNYLDIVPEDDIQTVETIFEQRTQVDQWVATCYRNVPTFASIPHNVAYTGADELVGNDIHRYSGNMITGTIDGFKIGDGLQSALSPISNSWLGSSYYGTIQYCNTFFENIDRTHNMTQDEKDLWTAEVKAVKAFYYFQLVRKYGPIILIDHTIGVEEETDEMKMPRVHVDTCFKEIVRLLDEAIEVLPLKNDKEPMRQGYFTKESAMALKAVALVYQASPLFNGNPNYATFTERNGDPLFSTSVDKEKWRIAAEACDAAIDVAVNQGGYHLVRGNSGEPTALLNTLKDIEQSVQAPGSQSDEIIFMAKQSNSTITSGLHYYAYTLPYFCQQSFLLSNPPSDGSMSPSMRMVEMYYTENGLPIDMDRDWNYEGRYSMRVADNDAKYNRIVPAGGQVLGLHLNREPRFYANIACDRLYWRGIVRDQAAETQTPLIVEAYRGERFGTNLESLQPTMNQNRTGYWLTKFIFTDLMVDNYANQVASKGDIPMPLIRLAQLYLMSSEAWNEYLDAPDDRVYAGIDTVRSRAGIPSVEEAWRDHSTNPTLYTTQVGMREIIHREMAIELAFEGQRFWDLRRWLEADVLREPQYGWNVVATDADGFYNYGNGPIPVWTLRGFQEPRDYLWPIQSRELMTSGVVQNPGW